MPVMLPALNQYLNRLTNKHNDYLDTEADHMSVRLSFTKSQMCVQVSTTEYLYRI